MNALASYEFLQKPAQAWSISIKHKSHFRRAHIRTIVYIIGAATYCFVSAIVRIPLSLLPSIRMPSHVLYFVLVLKLIHSLRADICSISLFRFVYGKWYCCRLDNSHRERSLQAPAPFSIHASLKISPPLYSRPWRFCEPFSHGDMQTRYVLLWIFQATNHQEKL